MMATHYLTYELRDFPQINVHVPLHASFKENHGYVFVKFASIVCLEVIILETTLKMCITLLN